MVALESLLTTMPVAYQIPPWLEPGKFVEAMSAGDQAGARRAQIRAGLQEASMRIAASAQQASEDRAMRMAEFQQRQQMAKEDALRQATKDGIDQAYQQATLGLRKQEFETNREMEQEKLRMSAEVAARKFAAQQDFVTERDATLAEMMGQGMDKVAATEKATALALLKHGPNMGATEGPMQSAFVALRPPAVPREPVHYDKVVFPEGNPEGMKAGEWSIGSTGGKRWLGPVPTDTAATKAERALVAAAMRNMLKDEPWLASGTLPASGSEKSKAEDQALLDEYNQLKSQLGGEGATANVPQGTKSLPKILSVVRDNP